MRDGFCAKNYAAFSLGDQSTSLMILKSKQSQAEQIKTISIGKARALRFKVLKPQKGVLEIVNQGDQGRICTLKISDFKSKADAEIYAQLLVLAPMLLDEYLSSSKTLAEVTERLRKRVERMRARAKRAKKKHD